MIEDWILILSHIAIFVSMSSEKKERLKKERISIFIRDARDSRPILLSVVSAEYLLRALHGIPSIDRHRRAEQETGIPTTPFHVAMPRKHVHEMISG